MKLSKYLADYIEYEYLAPGFPSADDIQDVIEQGIEAFESTEVVKIFTVSEEIADEIGQQIMEAEE